MFKPKTKFQSLKIVERLMTDDEIRERAAEMNLSEEVVKFIIEQFDMGRNSIEDSDGDLTENDLARGDGRIGCYQSHQEVRHELAQVMNANDDDEDNPEVTKVWERFFDE